MISVDPDDLHKKGRANGFSYAKGLICLGYYQLGINGKELARYFGISRPSVSQAVKRGEKFAKENDVKLLS
jgi:DNA-binding MarR family transcriptional regulator